MTYPFPPGGSGGFPPPPPGPPPGRVPTAPQFGQQFGAAGVPLRAFRPCLYRYTYVWLRNGRSFWFYPMYIDRNTGQVGGYRWRQYRWEYYTLNPGRVLYFSCF